MRRNISIIICIFMITTFAISFVPSNVYAMPSWDAIETQADDWLTRGDAMFDEVALQGIFIPFARLLLQLGTGILVVVTIIMGIKYITASPDEQGKLKQRLVGLVVSAIVLFGAQAIWALVYKIVSGL